MKILCPQCGEVVDVRGTSGRKPLNHSVIIITDVLQRRYERLRHLHSGRVKNMAVSDTARELGVSRAYVYQEIKKAGKTVDSVLEGVK